VLSVFLFSSLGFSFYNVWYFESKFMYCDIMSPCYLPVIHVVIFGDGADVTSSDITLILTFFKIIQLLQMLLG
jgi:hypothetical protein